MTKEEQFQMYIDYALNHFSDLVPYDDPNYEDKLMSIAIPYAEMEMNGYPPELEDLCKLHDEMMDEDYE